MESAVEMQMASDMFAFLGQIMLFVMIFAIAMYVYMSLALMAMAKRTNTPNAWMAWVPVLNVYLMMKVAGKPGWWLLLMFVPIVNFVIMLIVWMAMAERCGKPAWMGILIIVPIANIILPGLLAWSGDAPAQSAAPVQEGMPAQPAQPAEPMNNDNQPQI